jgi:hypothetical protein
LDGDDEVGAIMTKGNGWGGSWVVASAVAILVFLVSLTRGLLDKTSGDEEL